MSLVILHWLQSIGVIHIMLHHLSITFHPTAARHLQLLQALWALGPYTWNFIELQHLDGIPISKHVIKCHKYVIKHPDFTMILPCFTILLYKPGWKSSQGHPPRPVASGPPRTIRGQRGFPTSWCQLLTVDARKQTTDGEILQVMAYGLGFTGLPWEASLGLLQPPHALSHSKKFPLSKCH